MEITLRRLSEITIKRHIICQPLNLYLPENFKYFREKIAKNLRDLEYSDPRIQKLLIKQKGICLVCNELLNLQEKWEVHHVKPKKLGGKNDIKNLIVLHQMCHSQVTHTKDPKLLAIFKKKGIIK